MGPAVFVLREKYVPQYETAPRGTDLGRKRESAAGERTDGKRCIARMAKILGR